MPGATLGDAGGLFVNLTHNADGRLVTAARVDAAGKDGNYEWRTAETAGGFTMKNPLPTRELTGAWEVTFDPKVGGPEKPVTFDKLTDWTKRPEPGIRYYSGRATYRKTVDLPGLPRASAEASESLWLDLGQLQSIAQGTCQRPGRRHGLETALPGGHQPRGQGGCEHPGDRGRQRLAKPLGRRRTTWRHPPLGLHHHEDLRCEDPSDTRRSAGPGHGAIYGASAREKVIPRRRDTASRKSVKAAASRSFLPERTNVQ